MKGQNAFYEDEAGGRDGGECVGNAGVGGEVVDGALDGEALSEVSDVGGEELGLERVGVVEVALVAGIEGELGEVAVVEVEREKRGVELGSQLGGEGGFAGTRTAGDADDGGFGRLLGIGICGHVTRVIDRPVWVLGCWDDDQLWTGMAAGGGEFGCLCGCGGAGREHGCSCYGSEGLCGTEA